MNSYPTLPGLPTPLGAIATAQGHNFAVFAEETQQVVLALFAPGEPFPFLETPLQKTESIWHLEVCHLPSTFEYAYKIGKNYLFDPYAKELSSPHAWKATEKEYRPRGVVKPHDPHFSWEGVNSPHLPLELLVIYEMHVRAFTQDPSSKTEHPGTYLGVVEKIPYLKSLGINAVELLPICEFNEAAYKGKDPLTKRDLCNFWGYSTMNFFTPMNRYAKKNTLSEFKTMVKELHRAGIEVILDMVYNHTGEAGPEGEPLCYRGLAPKAYYIHNGEGKEVDFTGTGNTVSCNHPQVVQLIVDSLRYFVTEMHIDGFRFDLASIFTRGTEGSVLGDSPVLKAIREDPIVGKVKLIAEAWDAAGLYQVGAFPQWGPWSEWNGRYRDVVRRFIKGTGNCAGVFATAISGSQDLYGRFEGPLHSVNFVTAHDGFTLSDLVSYQEKHNERNGEENRDGTNDNESWNCGAEGNTKKRKILQVREQQARNLMLALLLSQGVPMLLMGDEQLHSKEGNNNTWCQDNRLNWLNWDNSHPGFTRFVKGLIQLRKQMPLFHQKEFLSNEEVNWHGHQPSQPDWSEESRFVAYTLKGQKGNCYVAFNSHFEPALVRLPEAPLHKKWYRIVDTSLPSPEDFIDHPLERPSIKQTYLLPPYSALLLLAH